MRQIAVIVEKADDGFFWCRTAEDINGDTMLSGCGATVADAKQDLLDCYGEAKADAEESGGTFEEVTFAYMTEFEKKLQELKPLMALTDSESAARKESLLQWIEANSESDENQAALNSFIESGIGDSKASIEALRSQTGSGRLD